MREGGRAPPAVCTLGFHEVGAQALSILSQVTALGTARRLLDKTTSFSTVSEESSAGQFAGGQSLFIGVACTTLYRSDVRTPLQREVYMLWG